MTRKRPTERRAYPRFELGPKDWLRVTVGPLGFNLTQGFVLNISRGGIKVRLSHMVFREEHGGECVVRFLNASEEIRPHSSIGIVRSIGDEQTERPFATIEFGQPLELLDLTRQEPTAT